MFFLLSFIALKEAMHSRFNKMLQEKSDHPLAVAIFSRNKTRDASYDKYVDMLPSGLVTQLIG